MENQCADCIYFIENKIDGYDEKGRPEYSFYSHCRLSDCGVDSTECCASYKDKKIYFLYINEVVERCFNLRRNGDDERAAAELKFMIKNLEKEFGL